MSRSSQLARFGFLLVIAGLLSARNSLTRAALFSEVLYSGAGGARLSKTGTDSTGLTNAIAGAFAGSGVAFAGTRQMTVEVKLLVDAPSLEKTSVIGTARFEDDFTISGGRGGARLFLNFISRITTSNAVPGVGTRIIAATAPNNHYLADPIDNTTPLFDRVPKFFTFDQPFNLKAEIAAWVEIQPGAVGFASSRLSTILYHVEVVHAATGLPLPFQMSAASGASYESLVAPALDIEPVGSAQVRVRWPASAKFYVLEKTLGLGEPWKRPAAEPEAAADFLQRADIIEAGPAFYRLRLWP